MKITTQEWSSVSLCEVAEIERTAVSPENIESGTSYVGLENMTSSGRFVGVGTVSNGDLASTKFAFTNKHILYGKLRPYLAKIARPEFAGVCSTDILPILPGPKMDRGFLLHFLRQPRMVDYASSRTTGANLPRLSPKALAEFEIPLPPLSEQKRIADILDNADAIRRKRQELSDATYVLTDAIFRELVGDPTTNPMHWEQLTYNEAPIQIIDGDRGKEYPKSADFSDEGFCLFLSAKNVTKRGFSFTERSFITEEKDRSMRKGKLKRHDVVVTTRGTVGNVAYFSDSVPYDDIRINSGMLILRADRDRIIPRFLALLLQSSMFQRQIEQLRSGSAQPQLPIRTLEHMCLLLPDIETQKVCVARIDAATHCGETFNRATNEAISLFNSLVQRAFKGEL